MKKSSNDNLSFADQERIRRSPRGDGVADTLDFTFAEAQEQIAASTELQQLYGALAQAHVSSLDTQRLRNPFWAKEAPAHETSDKQLQDSFDALSTPLLVLDQGGRIQLANRAWRHVYGAHNSLAPEGLIGQQYLQICPHLVEPSAMFVLARGLGAVLAGQRDSFRLLTAPQKDVAAARVCISRLVLNDTLYILAEHRQRRVNVEDVYPQHSEAFFRNLIEHSKDLILLLGPRGDILYANPFAHGSMPLTSATHPQSPLLYLVHPEERCAMEEVLQAVQSPSRTSTSQPLCCRLQQRDGSWRSFEGVLYNLLEHQEIRGVVFHARDVTESQELQSQLLQAERLADVGRLAASIGHEINNPLTYVLDHLEAVLEAWPTELASLPDNALRSRLQEALEGVGRVRMIARDLKNHCKLDIAIAPVDVHEPLEAALHMANNEIRHRAMLSRDFSQLPMIKGDHSRLEQVFLNLLLNAARGINEGQRNHNLLRVATYQTQAETVTIEISDTGPGIMPDALPHIFSPFYSTRSNGEGSGLGLFVCHRIITQLEGSIHVESVPGQGSTFYIQLPVAAQSTEPAFAHPAPTFHTNHVDCIGNILIIDDDLRVARALKRMLHPHQSTITNDGNEAIQLCQKPFDLIFCDLQMPRITGMDIYHTIGQINPKVQQIFVFMTGGAFTQQATSFCQQITRPLIGKPFDKQQIHQLVQDSISCAPP